MSLQDKLHNEYALSFGNYTARLLELERYDISDPYTHGNERQTYESRLEEALSPNLDPSIPEGSYASFYVHRVKKGRNDSFKGGSYGGIDIVHNGGFLIRSIHVSGQNIEGPRKCLDHILSLTGWTIDMIESHMKLIKCSWKKKVVPIYGARVGLTLKRADNILSWASYLIMKNRSAIYIPSKSKETFFIDNMDRTDISLRSIRRYKDEYDIGYNMANNGKTMYKDMSLFQISGYLSNHK